MLTTGEWLLRQAANESVVLQVGANDHSFADDTVVRLAMAAGWDAVLLEPTPAQYGRLAARYAGEPRVHLVREAVCPGTRSSCPAKRLPIWTVDTTNATGNWGSAHADVRCLSSMYGMADHEQVSGYASLSRQHVLEHEYLYQFNGAGCARCAARLGRSLPPDCMKDVLRANLVQRTVACACLARLLRDAAERGKRVRMLVVDAEGFDATVLAEYPLETHPPARIILETTHAGPHGATVRPVLPRLLRLGYTCTSGCGTRAVRAGTAGAGSSRAGRGTLQAGSYQSVWHRLGS